LRTSTVLATAFIWFGVAAAVTSSGLLAQFPMPFPQIVLATLTVTLLLLFARAKSLRNWLLQLDPRAFVAVHLTRFVGLYFIYLHFRSELPYAFAIPAGIGDTAVAVMAGVLALAVRQPLAHRGRRWVWLTWNTAGLADIVFVVMTATRLGINDPASMAALTRFPLGLLPTFLVPLIITSHIGLYVRLTKGGKRSGSNQAQDAASTSQPNLAIFTLSKRRQPARCASRRRRAALQKASAPGLTSVAPKKTFSR
jgi:hypothetical protein